MIVDDQRPLRRHTFDVDKNLQPSRCYDRSEPVTEVFQVDVLFRQLESPI